MSCIKCNRSCSGRASELGLDRSLQLGGAQLRRRLAVTGMHHRPTCGCNRAQPGAAIACSHLRVMQQILTISKKVGSCSAGRQTGSGSGAAAAAVCCLAQTPSAQPARLHTSQANPRRP